MSTDKIQAALYEHFPAQEYAVLFEVGKSTGAGTSGWADAMAMSLWPSRGLTLHGFEIKAYRSDWLRELKNPAKADDFVALCDQWSIVAAEGIVKLDGLPPTWGLFELINGKLKQRRAAPRLPGSGESFKRTFVAAMLRRAAEADRGTTQRLADKEVERRRALDDQRVQAEIERRSRRHSELANKLEEIKKLTGIDLEHWTPSEEIGQTIRAVLDGNLFAQYGGLATAAKDAKKLADQLEKVATLLAPKAAA